MSASSSSSPTTRSARSAKSGGPLRVSRATLSPARRISSRISAAPGLEQGLSGGGQLAVDQPPSQRLGPLGVHRVEGLQDALGRRDAQLGPDLLEVQERLDQRAVHVEDDAVEASHRLRNSPICPPFQE